MVVTPIKSRLVHPNDDLFSLLKESLPAKKMVEKVVLVVTSKVVALSEGATAVNLGGTREEKQNIVKEEADYFLDPSLSNYQMMLTIKHSVLAVNAGLDESNGNGQYVLLPKNPYESAKKIWNFVKAEYKLKEVGILITDSKTFPLKWGTMGTALAYCGFKPLKNLIGEPDLFGVPLVVTQVNVAEGLAASAVVEMGEADEAQPFCLIEGASAVEFTQNPPTSDEIAHFVIDPKDDIYAPILTAVNWQKGESKHG